MTPTEGMMLQAAGYASTLDDNRLWGRVATGWWMPRALLSPDRNSKPIATATTASSGWGCISRAFASSASNGASPAAGRARALGRPKLTARSDCTGRGEAG